MGLDPGPIVQAAAASMDQPLAEPEVRRSANGVLNTTLSCRYAYKEIGGQLFISEETVRSHVKSILAKIDQPNRTQAVVTAVKMGLIILE